MTISCLPIPNSTLSAEPVRTFPLDSTRYRNCHPTLGRWIERDPVQEGPDLYESVGSNPVCLTDPKGLAPASPITYEPTTVVPRTPNEAFGRVPGKPGSSLAYGEWDANPACKATADNKSVGYLTDVKARFISKLWSVTPGSVTAGPDEGYRVTPRFAADTKEHEQEHIAAARAVFDVLAPQYVAIASRLESAPKATPEEAVSAILSMYFSLITQVYKLADSYESNLDKEIDKQTWTQDKTRREYINVGTRGDWRPILERDPPTVSVPAQE
jgi:hypothetical protein